MKAYSNAEQLASLKAAADEARQAGKLKEWQLANGITARIFPASEMDEDREQQKISGIAILITPSAETKEPREAVTNTTEDIRRRLPEGLTIPKGRDRHYLSDKGEFHDTGAIFIALGNLELPAALAKLNTMLEKMADPQLIEVTSLKRGPQRGTRRGES